jgi:alpha-tubulin suppressor-like RCC1 family protein
VCALNGSGNPYCWGSNVKGRLGTGNTITSATPIASNTSTTFVSIKSGARHSCALTSAGVMECWDDNSFAQMLRLLLEVVWVTQSQKNHQVILLS